MVAGRVSHSHAVRLWGSLQSVLEGGTREGALLIQSLYLCRESLLSLSIPNSRSQFLVHLIQLVSHLMMKGAQATDDNRGGLNTHIKKKYCITDPLFKGMNAGCFLPAERACKSR